MSGSRVVISAELVGDLMEAVDLRQSVIGNTKVASCNCKTSTLIVGGNLRATYADKIDITATLGKGVLVTADCEATTFGKTAATKFAMDIVKIYTNEIAKTTVKCAELKVVIVVHSAN
ncbi:hypothetical protein N898_16960 [Salmonella enterica subsp. arizonae serovar 62:z36:- str. RKS2983]|nr:hypothetical protein N898_16960 [Salmonella enterica subsp. arizonae serovar 62:z36:- str. RKS2983]